ncbi:MAG: hypothetical protein M3387_07865 [Actinomycetota bacterium]|nr:hypothetical protein [Actinomycetota bacterium]
MSSAAGALPNLVVIGAMKCGSTRSPSTAIIGPTGDLQAWSTEHQTQLDQRLASRLVEALQDDADRLGELAGRDLPGWSL